MNEKLMSRVDYMSVYGLRDDALFWIDLFACECLNLLRIEEPWLNGVPNVIEPEEMLSDHMRPGTDSMHGLTHRINSLLRRVRPEMEEQGSVLKQAVEDMDALFDELERVFKWLKITDARLAFHAIIDYSFSGNKLRHSPERFAETLKSMAAAFLATWNDLYEFCQSEEAVRKRVPIPNAYDRQIEETVEETHHLVLARKGRGRPVRVSFKTQVWMIEKWNYLVRHPEACRANISGSKVTYLDFWETYEQALRERGITTQEAAARALKTALANHREGRLG